MCKKLTADHCGKFMIHSSIPLLSTSAVLFLVFSFARPALADSGVIAAKMEEYTAVAKTHSAPLLQETINGLVKDQVGKPLRGVSVLVKGTSRGATTDEKGAFQILADEGEVLAFSYMGYRPTEVTVGTQRTLDVVLVAGSESLDEVVVIGYGAVRRSDLTGSVSQIKAEEINAFPNSNVLQGISGRASGVQVRQASGAPGPGMSVRIRGGNSIQGSNEPLYVIDGFPVTGSNPTQLNPADVESIEILKDASATAIYGSRGANGVVLITTKRGRAGRTNVDFETSLSSQTLIRKLDLMNASEYAQFYNLQATNDNLTPYFTQEQINAFGEGFDWQDFVFRRAPMSTAALNINGGTEKTQFSLSGSYFGQNGIIEGSDYDRYSLQMGLNHNINDKLRVEFSSTLSQLTTLRRDSGGGNRGNTMIAAAVSSPPTLTPFNDDGSYRVLHTEYPFLATDLRNPINFMREQSSQIKANVALINTAVSYNITPDLVLKIAGGIENRDERTDNYTTRLFFNSPGIASISSGQSVSLLNENTLSYNKTFAEKHNFSAVAGFTYQDFLNTSVNASGSGFLSDIFGSHNLGAAATPAVPGSNYSKAVLLSYLARVNYIYDDRYLATLSIRRDGSSRYSEGHKWGNFPSAAIAWRASNEEFLKDNVFISELKVRASWGLTGNQAINPYTTLNNLFPGQTILNDDLFVTFAPATQLPGTLRWESTEQIDVGLDFGILDNRVLLTADYYIKNTRDLLSPVILPSSMGYTSTIQNVGHVQNKGLELGLEARILGGNFLWDINGNIAFNRNKVISLNNGEDLFRDNIAMVVVNDVTSILREGQPVGRFWGYLEEGYDANGNIIFADTNGDGAITLADKTYIGDPNPNFIYGFNSDMRYKNFELNLFFQGSYGNDIFNASAITNTMDYGFGLNMHRSVLYDHWTPQNTDAAYPRISRSTPIRVSDRFIEDGSYLRLKNIMLAYNLPVADMGINWATRLQVYVSGQNLWTLTNYSWWDPETNFRMDHNSYPVAKSVTFGIRAGF